MSEEILNKAAQQMKKMVESLHSEFQTVRTGRATPSLLDEVRVEYYGSKVPVNQVAQVRIPEAQLIVLQVWDVKAVPDVEKAILKSGIGLNPSVDGQTIRLSVPSPTEEKRKELVKKVKGMSEKGKVSVRGVRRDMNEEIKGIQKEGELTEDQERQALDKIQKLTDQNIANIDKLVADKEKEIMQI